MSIQLGILQNSVLLGGGGASGDRGAGDTAPGVLPSGTSSGLLVVEASITQPNASAAQPISGLRVAVQSEREQFTRPVLLVTNRTGMISYRFPPGPYELFASRPGYLAQGAFQISRGKTTDFVITVTSVDNQPSLYDIRDQDSSFMIESWNTIAVRLPTSVRLAHNQTVFFIAFPAAEPLFRGNAPLPTPLSISALVIGDYSSPTGQWVMLKPLGQMPIIDFAAVDVLSFYASSRVSYPG